MRTPLFRAGLVADCLHSELQHWWPLSTGWRSDEGSQALQPSEDVRLAAPLRTPRIRAQERFGRLHGLALRFQVRFGIDAGRREAGVAHPAADRDHVHARVQEMGRGRVPFIPSSESEADPSHAPSLSNLAVVLANFGLADEAEKYLREAI